MVHSCVCGLGSELCSSSLGTLLKVQLDVGWACSSNVASSHVATNWCYCLGAQLGLSNGLYSSGSRCGFFFHCTVVILFRRPKSALLAFLERDSYKASALPRMVRMSAQGSQRSRQKLSAQGSGLNWYSATSAIVCRSRQSLPIQDSRERK